MRWALRAQRSGLLAALVIAALEAHELGDVLDPVEDVGELSGAIEDRAC
jgi:predicted HD phosphohydrolase